MPLKGSIAHAEGSFPFVTFMYVDQMVGMSEVGDVGQQVEVLFLRFCLNCRS